MHMTAKELKAWRESKGFSQKELASILGVTIVCISRWENKARKIPSFLNLALECLDKKGGEKKSSKRTRALKGKKTKKERRG
jgi:transcriptional regulator with XRE-family HTH domain